MKIDGTSGRDSLSGTSSNDQMYGGRDRDQIRGNGGNDTISGGGGADTLHGGSGNDTIYGGSSKDKIYGGSGSDDIYAGTGVDTLTGGSGDDSFYFGRNDGTNTIKDFDASKNDRIVLSDHHYAIAQNGDDVRITFGETVINVENASTSDVNSRIISPSLVDYDKARTQDAANPNSFRSIGRGISGLPYS